MAFQPSNRVSRHKGNVRRQNGSHRVDGLYLHRAHIGEHCAWLKIGCQFRNNRSISGNRSRQHYDIGRSNGILKGFMDDRPALPFHEGSVFRGEIEAVRQGTISCPRPSNRGADEAQSNNRYAHQARSPSSPRSCHTSGPSTLSSGAGDHPGGSMGP